jgi:formate/nitrite transporter FocA (FNT family)
MISIGGIVYLSVDSKTVGAFLFGIGLFVILLFDLPLFTGKVGFIKSKEDLLNLIPI